MDDDRTRAGGWLAVRLQEKSYPSLAPVTELQVLGSSSTNLNAIPASFILITHI